MSTQRKAKRKSCPVCDHGDISVFLTLPETPVHCNLLWEGRAQAIRAPRGELELTFCNHCGHVFNRAFDPDLTEYGETYENTLHHSPRFQQYAESAVRRLVERYDLRQKRVVEIGSGQGDFLKMLCAAGDNRGVGYDPSYIPTVADAHDARVTFVPDYYTKEYAGQQADLILSRHVLEHIPEPQDFLRTVREAIRDPETLLFFEVPNVLFTLKDQGIWDLIYEHPSYFSPGSMETLFRRAGFEPMETYAAFGGQYLCIVAAPNGEATAPAPRADDLRPLVRAFAEHYRQQVTSWARTLSDLNEREARVVSWGAGSKGVTFLNALKEHSRIEYIVDINPRKQGKFTPGTGQEIVVPAFLSTYQPDVVIVMNPLYEAEIAGTLEQLGVEARVLIA